MATSGTTGAVTCALASLLVLPCSARADLVLRAKNPTALTRFYREVVGLELRAEDSTLTAFGLGSETLVVLGGGQTDAQSNLRLLVRTHDLDSARATLLRADVSVDQARDPEGRLVALLFDDPEGNPVGILRQDAPPTWALDVASGHDVLSSLDASSGRTVHSGKTEFAIWSGLHGVGLGFAVPYSLGSDSPTAIGLTMMASGPAAAVAAYQYGKRTALTRGTARALEFGGDFAMWQAFGWAGVGDLESEDVLLSGTGGLLTGVAAAALLTRGRDVSPGQAGLFFSAANWGAWFGLVGARIADANRYVDGDETLGAMLVTSAVGATAGGLTALRVDMPESRLAWINLGGILGTAFGFGLDLVLQVDDDAAVWAIPGATGVGALAFTTWFAGRNEPAPNSGQLLGAEGPESFAFLAPSITPSRTGWRAEFLRARF